MLKTKPRTVSQRIQQEKYCNHHMKQHHYTPPDLPNHFPDIHNHRSDVLDNACVKVKNIQFITQNLNWTSVVIPNKLSLAFIPDILPT